MPRSTWWEKLSITPIRVHRPPRTRCPRVTASRPSRAGSPPSPPTITRSSSGSSPCTMPCTPSASARPGRRPVGLERRSYIDLPPHTGPGGFDHAAIHQGTRRLYVAHTANHAVDLIDCEREMFVRSIDGLPAVAGVLISDESGWAFTSNRGEDTVGIFRPRAEDEVAKVPVGMRPNGLAFDAGRGTLLAANVRGSPGAWAVHPGVGGGRHAFQARRHGRAGPNARGVLRSRARSILREHRGPADDRGRRSR